MWLTFCSLPECQVIQCSIFGILIPDIVGVYGAFQLENWGEEPREKQCERMLPEQLHSEIEYAYPLMEAQVESRARHVSGATQVASRLMQAYAIGQSSAKHFDGFIS